MNHKLLRFAYACEFLLAVAAVFTAWPEIAGQAPLDAMDWGWKFGFGLVLPAGVVGYTAAIVAEEKIASARAARWLAFLLLLLIAMSVVTYYYTLEAETGESDEPAGTVSLYSPDPPAMSARS